MSGRSPDQIERELAGVMQIAFPDRDLPMEVGPETRIFADLGLASIDVVVLGERLEQFYGRRLPFGPFLAGLRAKGADDLAVGDLISFLREHV